jgi:hypothetical protein
MVIDEANLACRRLELSKPNDEGDISEQKDGKEKGRDITILLLHTYLLMADGR